MDRHGGEVPFGLLLEQADSPVVDALARIALQDSLIGREHPQVGERDRTTGREDHVTQ
jgi:hypothetical protein